MKGQKNALASVLAVVFIFVLFLVIILSIIGSLYDMTFRKKYVLTGVRIDSVQTVPPVLRQTWKNDSIPDRNKPWVQSWLTGLPSFSRVLETDASIEAFVAAEFPYYLPVWNRLTPIIKKIDTVRYMWMLRHGGIYTDMDTSLRDGAALQKLLTAKLQAPVAFIPASHSKPIRGRDAASPAFLGSQPRHPIWVHMLRYIAQNGWNPEVKRATGPNALTSVLKDWKDGGNTESVMLVSEPMLGIGWLKDAPFLKHYIRHHNTSGWSNGAPAAPWTDIPSSVFEGLDEELKHLKE